MTLRNRIKAAVEAFMTDPDRTVYLKDAPGGSHRQAIYGRSVTGGDTDAEALRAAALFIELDEDNDEIARVRFE